MSDANKTMGLQLRSRISKSGELELSLAEVAVPEPGPDQVVVKVEATPINPSDLGLLLGPIDMATAKATGSGNGIKVTAKVAEAALPFLAARLDQAMPVGNEGAGTVIKAGSSEAAQALLGKTVSMVGGAMYAQYRLLKATDCQPLPAGTSAAEGASWFVNPLTALGMTETMKREGPKALVHTAAAIAFDAIGGGKLASQILTAMEAAINKTATTFNRYGSSVHKQVYVYGGLNTGP